MRRRAAAEPDRAIARFADRIGRPWLDQVAKVVSSAGRGGVAWALAAGGTAARRGGMRTGAAAAGAVFAAFGASAGAARVFGRARPFEKSARVRRVGERPAGPSFPSDQAAAAGAGAYVLSTVLPHRRLPVWGAAALAGAARVYAGVHYPSDVVAGTAAGAAVGRAWKWLVFERSG